MVTPDKDAVKAFMQAYGPFAFGIVSLLVLWYFIMNPQLERQQLDFDAQRQILDLSRQQSQELDKVARQLKETLVILERVVDKLDEKDSRGNAN